MMIPMFWTLTFIGVIVVLCLNNQKYARNIKRYKYDLMKIGIAIGITLVICLGLGIVTGSGYMFF
ncbi:hypothetical protein [Companilactobacillus hulinensis]|uniref:hypothetical protein n=1 Tax=Companilactobacillus hulinensis TaxID=2486007 RepID=UPI000F7B5EB0|nr:hypothetical protein [Companilactobacillus hulinensis]